MAWSRTGLKGMNAPDPVSLVKQGPDVSHIFNTGQIGTLVNHKNKPGDFSWHDLDDVYFNGVNIIQNGTFADATEDDTADGNLVGWFNGGTHSATNHFTISGGACNIIRGGAGTFYIYQNVLTSVGTYTYSINVTTIGQGVNLYTYNSDLSEATAVVNLSAGVNTGAITTNASSINFAIFPSLTSGTTIIDDIVLTPDNKHIPDDTNGTDFGGIEESSISYWFRDDGSTTT
jgi:hypothetical protein